MIGYKNKQNFINPEILIIFTFPLCILSDILSAPLWLNKNIYLTAKDAKVIAKGAKGYNKLNSSKYLVEWLKKLLLQDSDSWG